MAKTQWTMKVGGKGAKNGNVMNALRFGQRRNLANRQKAFDGSEVLPVDVFMNAMNRKYGSEPLFPWEEVKR